jgi:drug/metabolite transporter (DMT)-like permease
MAGIILLIDLFGAGRFRLDQVGVAAGIASAFAFAFYNIGAHGILKRYDRWSVILYVTGGATLFWLVVNPPWKIAAAGYRGIDWGFLVVFAVVSALAPFAFYAAGLEHLEPHRAMIGACMEPVFSIALAAVALGELVRPTQLMGIVVVLSAIVAVEWPGRKRVPAEAVIDPIE